jgi:hypothetical protein
MTRPVVSMNRVACGVLALLAFVALLVVQFNVPWASSHASSGLASSDTTARTWGQDQTGSAFGFSGHDSKNWFDGGWDDSQQDAVNQLRVAGPLLAGGALLLLVGAILALAMPTGTGPIVTLIGAVVTGAATALYYIALDDLFSEPTWEVGFFVTLGGAVLGLVGGVLGLLGGTARQTTY